MQNGYDPLDLLTIQEAAKIIRKRPETIREYIKRGMLRAIKRFEGHRRPQQLYVTRGELERFIYNEFNNYDDARAARVKPKA